MNTTPMLVLTRKKGERIVLGGDIFLEVVEIRGDKVRLGVLAPKEAVIHRSEVAQALRDLERQKQEAPPLAPIALENPVDTKKRLQREAWENLHQALHSRGLETTGAVGKRLAKISDNEQITPETIQVLHDLIVALIDKRAANMKRELLQAVETVLKTIS